MFNDDIMNINNILPYNSFLVGLLIAIAITAQIHSIQAQDAKEGISFAVFTDQHYAQGMFADDSYSKNKASKYLTDMTHDVMNHIPKVDFGLGLGDAVHDKTRWIGEWKELFYSNLNLPYYLSHGDHDIVNYQQYDNHLSPFPYKTLQVLLEEREITTPTFAMLRSNILFLVIGDKGPIEKIHETQKEWVEYMVQAHPDKTTILISHAPVRGTTGASNRHDWGWRHSEMWWWNLFHENPQIKAFINGDGHCMSFVIDDNNDNEGYSGTNGSWGHEMAFIEPPSQGFFVRDTHNKNEFSVITITDKTLSTRSWRNEGEGGWADDFTHEWEVPGGTSYDETEDDWYSFPVFLQDGELQVLPNDVIPSQNVKLQLIGMRSYSLFNNPEIIAGHTSDYEKVSGFGGDNEVSYHREGYMEIQGPETITFPDKDSYQNKEKGGKSGQIKNYLFHGSTPQAIPGANYKITITAKSESGKGKLSLDMSTSDWSTQSQYSILKGSKQSVMEVETSSEYRTFSANYQAPQDDDVWFLQGSITCEDPAEYTISSFEITRQTHVKYTQDFHLQLGNQTYKQKGRLAENEAQSFSVDPVTLTDGKGNLRFKAQIGGNHVGMARVIHHYPLLYGRNARFTIDSYSGDKVNVTFNDVISRYISTFKVLPFKESPGKFSVTPGKIHTSGNGTVYGTSVIKPGKKVEIVFPDLGK